MKHLFAVFLLLFLSFGLRWHNYAVYPQRGATSDEYAFAFQGISLLTKGVPTAWSAIPVYENKQDLTIRGLYFPLVTPYLDHPPLFGLLAGGWSVLNGEVDFAAVRLETIRMVPLVLSVISSIFVYLLARQLFGKTIAVWSLAIYAAVPLFAVNSRVVVAETLMTPLWLAALWLTCRITATSSSKTLLSIGLLCAALLFTKVPAVVAWISVAGILRYRKASVRQHLLVSGAAVIGLLALYTYGRIYNEQLFLSVQAYQGTSRVLGLDTIRMILGSPSIVNTVYYDGWYFWGYLRFLLRPWMSEKTSVSYCLRYRIYC
jgi:4-amino-4-deoxy-L-arabinose transferase-like glycosyltransferase